MLDNARDADETTCTVHVFFFKFVQCTTYMYIVRVDTCKCTFVAMFTKNVVSIVLKSMRLHLIGTVEKGICTTNDLQIIYIFSFS